ncbi:unnamed protein product [Discula destructiva]
MYEIRPAGGKGLGVFAKQLIPRGTRIFSERPLLSIAHGGEGTGAGAILRGLRALNAGQRTALLGLSEGAPRGDVAVLRWGQVAWYRAMEALKGGLGSHMQARVEDARRPACPSQQDATAVSLKIKEHVRILAIFRSNAFDIGLDRQAVFPSISRINHSCIPSAEGHFHEGLGTLNVHATRDIRDGEEVMINYLKETGVALRGQRQAKLLEGYGFDCNCGACDAQSQRGQEGERRRVIALSTLAEYAQRVAHTGVPFEVTQSDEAELAIIVGMVKLFDEESLSGRALSLYYLEASKLCVKLGRSDEALLYAENALKINEDCLGPDHELYREGLDIVRSLKAKELTEEGRNVLLPRLMMMQ